MLVTQGGKLSDDRYLSIKVKGPLSVLCDPNTLEIKEIPDDSALAKWNTNRPHEPIHVGDSIWQVNGVNRSAPIDVLYELDRPGHMQLTVQRMGTHLRTRSHRGTVSD